METEELMYCILGKVATIATLTSDPLALFLIRECVDDLKELQTLVRQSH